MTENPKLGATLNTLACNAIGDTAMTPDIVPATAAPPSSGTAAGPQDADGDDLAGEVIGPLSFSGLEEVYDALAEGIDEAGIDASERFLVKLALLNAQALGDPALVRRHITIALRDL